MSTPQPPEPTDAKQRALREPHEAQPGRVLGDREGAPAEGAPAARCE